jgi:hypothetical protein
VRTKAIMVGAIAALALATLSASAGTRATPGVSGSLVSLVTATTTVTAAADRDAGTPATQSTANEKTSELAEKPVVAVKPAERPLLQRTAACQQAISALKTMQQADVAEDAAERAAQQSLSPATLALDRAEDLAEIARWKQALMAARTACQPQPTAACQAALTSLQTLLAANRPEEWSELVKLPTQIDLAALRAALTAVATACADRD